MKLEDLGKPMTAKEVAKVLGVAPNTVLRHADHLGAFRLGGRTLFFENRIVEVLNGIENNQERPCPMESPRPARRGNKAKTVRDQGRGPDLGVGHAQQPHLGSRGADDGDPNRHGLDVGE